MPGRVALDKFLPCYHHKRGGFVISNAKMIDGGRDTMTNLQQQQVAELMRYGWEVAVEKGDHVEMLHITLPNGAFSIAYVHPFGSFTWEGSYPLARLWSMYPAYDYMAGE